MNDLDLDHILEASDLRVAKLYNPDCMNTVTYLASRTPCWETHSRVDPVCGGCPIASACKEAKDIKNGVKRGAREARMETLQKALSDGFDLASIKVPKKVRMKYPVKVDALYANTYCVATGIALPEGDSAVHIEGWGILHNTVYEYLMELENI